MKRISRKTKIALTTSLATVAFVPLITIVATSCSSTSHKKTSETYPSLSEDNTFALKNYTFNFPIEPLIYWQTDKHLDQFIFNCLKELNPELLKNVSDYQTVFKTTLERTENNQTCKVTISLLNHYKFAPSNTSNYQLNSNQTSVSFQINTEAFFDYEKFAGFLNKLTDVKLVSNQNLSETIINACLQSGLDASNILSASAHFNPLNGTITSIKINLRENQRIMLSNTNNSWLLKNNIITINNPIKTQIQLYRKINFSQTKQEQFKSWLNSLNVSQLTKINIYNQLVSLEIDKNAISINNIAIISDAYDSLVFNVTISLNTGYVFSDGSSSLEFFNITPKQDLKVYWLSPIFANTVNIVNNFSTDFSKPKVLLSKNNINSSINLISGFGLKGINSPVTLSTALKSNTLSEIYDDLLNINGIESAIKNEISYNFVTELESLFASIGLVSWSLNENNVYFADSLNVSKQNNELVISGKIGFEFFNNQKQTITIPAFSSFFHNDKPLSIKPNAVFGFVYDFDKNSLNPDESNINSNIVFNNNSAIPGSISEKNPNGIPVGTGMYSLKINKATQYFISGLPNSKAKTYNENNVITSPLLISNFYPFNKQSTLIDLELPQVLNEGNLDYYDSQDKFKKYLNQLNTSAIKEQLVKQDNAIWNFVLNTAHSVQILLDSFANNVSISQFLYNLQTPLTVLISELTGNKQLANLVGGLFSNVPFIKYLKENKDNAEQVIKFLLSVVSQNPQLYKTLYNRFLEHLPVKIFSNNPFASSLASLDNNSVSNQFSDILKKLATNPKLFQFINNLLKLGNSESLVQILGTQTQAFLELVLSSAATNKNSAAYQLLNSINQLLEALEAAQNVQNVGDLKVLDFFQNQKQSQILLNFIQTSLLNFLSAVSEQTAQTFKTHYLPFIDLIFNIYYKLHLNDLSNFFKVLAHPLVDGVPQTLEYVLKNCIQYSNNVDVSSYQNGFVSFTNQMNFVFKNNVSFDISSLVKTIGNDTIGDIFQILNQVLNLNLTSPFSAKTFIDAVLEKNNVNNSLLTKVIACFAFANPDNLSSVKLATIFKNVKLMFTKNESVTVNFLAHNQVVIPTINDYYLTWKTNVNILTFFNLNTFLANIINPITDWLANWFNNPNNEISEFQYAWWTPAISLGYRIAGAIRSAASSVLSQLSNRTFNFLSSWTNKIHSLNQTKIYNYTKTVLDSNYQVIFKPFDINNHNLQTNPTLNTLNNLLNQSQYFSYYNNKYTYYPNNLDLTNQILSLLVNQSDNTWNNFANPLFRPVVQVQYVAPINLTLDIPLGVFGINIPINHTIQGFYKVAIKFPTKVAISFNNGKTYQMLDEVNYQFPTGL